MKYNNIREEELKNKVGFDWFKQFDTTKILGNIDFTVFPNKIICLVENPCCGLKPKQEFLCHYTVCLISAYHRQGPYF